MKNWLKWTIFTGLFIVPFVPFLVSSSFFFPFITTKAFAWRLIVEIVFAAWVLLALLDTAYRPKKSLVAYGILGFIVIIGLADIFGAAPIKSFWSNFERMEGFIALLHLGMFFLVTGSFFREIDWKRWWNTNLAASFLMVLYCIFQLLGVNEIHQGGVRLDGTLGNAIYLAVYMLFNIFIAILFIWREWKNVTLRYVYGILILLQSMILYYTATRGAILGLIGGVIVMAVLNLFNKDEGGKAVKKASIIILSSIVLLIGVFFAARNTTFVTGNPVLSRFSSLTTAEIKTQGRYFVWPIAIKGVKEHPILGWGQENFNYIFNKYYQPEMYNLEPWFDRAHNIFLDWLVTGGILGLCSYLFLYVALLYLIWKRDEHFSHTEKSILTGLIAAYFFHNFFVFDHLISYVLFFSLLSYVHSRVPKQASESKSTFAHGENTLVWAAPAVAILLIAMVYFVNLKPYLANTRLLAALYATQSGQDNGLAAANLFKSSYNSARLGQPEVVEQIASNAGPILGSKMTDEQKNEFFNFARTAVLKQAEDTADDARYQLIAGSFLSIMGDFNGGVKYLQSALELMPGKQLIYIEVASAYLNKGDTQNAIKILRELGEISPDHKQQADEYIRQIQSGQLK